MSITYWLSFENMERCFTICRKGTVFEKEPACITAYEVCKGLNEYYQESDVFKTHIPLRDASTGTRFSECATTGNIDKMIRWLREKHGIFYFPAMNLCIPLEDPLSRSVKKFWDEEDAQQKQIEEYCKNDVAVAVAASEELGSDGCTVCKGRVCDQFIDILNALGVKGGVLYSARGQSKVDACAKAAKSRAEVIFKEHQKQRKQIDELYERIHNQESIIKTQNESLTKQRKQLKDLGASLRDIKEVVDCEMDDLMKTHGDDIIPMF